MIVKALGWLVGLVFGLAVKAGRHLLAPPPTVAPAEGLGTSPEPFDSRSRAGEARVRTKAILMAKHGTQPPRHDRTGGREAVTESVRVTRERRAPLEGVLVAFGNRTMQDRKHKGRTYKTFCVEVEVGGGIVTRQGVELEPAIRLADAQVGDRVRVINVGRVPVTVAEGEHEITSHKNLWQIEVLERRS